MFPSRRNRRISAQNTYSKTVQFNLTLFLNNTEGIVVLLFCTLHAIAGFYKFWILNVMVIFLTVICKMWLKRPFSSHPCIFLVKKKEREKQRGGKAEVEKTQVRIHMTTPGVSTSDYDKRWRQMHLDQMCCRHLNPATALLLTHGHNGLALQPPPNTYYCTSWFGANRRVWVHHKISFNCKTICITLGTSESTLLHSTSLQKGIEVGLDKPAKRTQSLGEVSNMGLVGECRKYTLNQALGTGGGGG